MRFKMTEINISSFSDPRLPASFWFSLIADDLAVSIAEVPLSPDAVAVGHVHVEVLLAPVDALAEGALQERVNPVDLGHVLTGGLGVLEVLAAHVAHAAAVLQQRVPRLPPSRRVVRFWKRVWLVRYLFALSLCKVSKVTLIMYGI